jgi:hypothetical protein
VQRNGPRFKAGLITDTWKKNVADYFVAAQALLKDMQANGFRADQAIPVDPNGELLGGAHRAACALSLGIETVPVTFPGVYVWAPPWDYRWFLDHGLERESLDQLMKDYSDRAS